MKLQLLSHDTVMNIRNKIIGKETECNIDSVIHLNLDCHSACLAITTTQQFNVLLGVIQLITPVTQTSWYHNNHE